MCHASQCCASSSLQAEHQLVSMHVFSVAYLETIEDIMTLFCGFFKGFQRNVAPNANTYSLLFACPPLSRFEIHSLLEILWISKNTSEMCF